MFNEQLEARNLLIDKIRQEMLGPGSEPGSVDIEHEVLSASPSVRYCVGILFPQNMEMKTNDDDVVGEEGTGKEEIIDPDENLKAQEEMQESLKGSADRKSDRTVIGDDFEDSLDEAVAMSNKILPSSMGLTFLSETWLDKINIHVKAAAYVDSKLEDCQFVIDKSIANGFSVPEVFQHLFFYDKETHILKLMGKVDPRKDIKYWYDQDKADDGTFKPFAYKLVSLYSSGKKRVPLVFDEELDFSNGDYYKSKQYLGDTKLKIYALRYKLANKYCSYTIMLVNEGTSKRDVVEHYYQPEISITTDDNANLRFCDYSVLQDASNEEELSNRLLYRKKKNYGNGLGTALNWSVTDEGKGWIKTDFFPSVDVPQMEFGIEEKYSVNQAGFSMKYLSDLDSDDKDNKIQKMQIIINAYRKWINELDKALETLPSGYTDIARDHISKCKFCYERLNKGLSILRENDTAWDAFCLANRAMFMQRLHIEIQNKYEDCYPGNEDLEDELETIDYRTAEDKYFWRPFQLAFLIMSIASIVDDSIDNDERNLVDLIWFPTGGGKTEAYLGLTAFTIFFRKLTHLNQSDGTAVIMRYTLRLLASQQFTRASTLICACEIIRKESSNRRSRYPKYQLGNTPITIGLWIGGQHTPNKVSGGDSDAKTCCKKLEEAKARDLLYIKERYNKFQVLKCPWCGTKLVKDVTENQKIVGKWGYSVHGKHFKISCTQDGCPFSEKLPLQVVDSELYENPPTLLFATVDKFAVLPWYKETGNFFAVDSVNRSPELIIQDELHLISGPLGSIVGLYETGIDYLCSLKGIKPKIIASTATICRAKEQCSSLYNREVFQFPPQGLDESDSFFARAASVEEKFGRKYIGIMPAGKTKAMMESRLFAALLQFEQEMQAPAEVKDCYWTNTAYFNSIKELGKSSTIVQNDVRDNIRRMANRNNFIFGRRNILRADELTSRVSTTQLNQTLNKLEKVHFSDDPNNKTYPSNMLLATNMISVGIDVDRLNIMVMVGQPKLTSEYIQASSRVGRKYPGVVFTMYDTARSRDRSHFEQFKSYHESFYKNVEPTGVTPFSEPARQRALHAVIISILRHGYGLREDKDISGFDIDTMKNQLKEITKYITSRIDSINDRLTFNINSESNDTEQEISFIYEKINMLANAAKHRNLEYGNIVGFPPEEGHYRLLKPFRTDTNDELTFETLTSMRNVDSGANVNVVILETVDEQFC